MKKRNLALVLSGGGARGMAHIGVIRILEREGIVPDVVVGTSAGALVGGMYAAGALYAFEDALFKLKSLRELLKFRPSKEGLLKTDRLEADLRSLIRRMKIEELKKKFVAVAVDIKHGRKVLLDKGDLCEAILASMAIPFLFYPIRKGDKLLVDGSLLDPLPITEGFRLAKKVIAVNVNTIIEDLPKKERYNFVDIFERVTIVIQSKIQNFIFSKYGDNLLILNPKTSLRTFDFNRSMDAIDAGKEEATKKLAKIRKLVKS